MRVVELSNSANWETLYSTTVNAVSVPMQNGTYLHSPIPEIIVPFVLDTFILAVNVETDVPANSIWRFAGNCNQKISTGLVVGGGQDATTVKGCPLFLNQLNLIFFEKISTNYSVSIKVPKWFTSAQLIIWQYTGTDTDSIENLLGQIKNVDLPRVEAKIDAL
ncbi:MAG: hypothetical protein V7K47_02195 [Nostoc sp.]